MNRFRTATHFSFTAVLIVLAMFAAILSLPVSSYAFGSFPPLSNTGAPGQSTCAGCHGTVTAGSGVLVNAPKSYTPGGAAVPMTVTIPATGGYELEVVTQTSNAQAGALATADANSAVSTVGALQFAFSTGETTTWTFSWMPPATNVGSVVLYVTGGGHGTNYSNNFVMTPAAATQPPAISSFVSGSSSITAGNSTTLTGTFSNGTGMVDNSVGSVTSGTAMTVKPAVTTTYTLTVSGTGTPATAKVTVTVTPAAQPPAISSFVSGSSSITAGNSTTLTGTFTNGTGMVDNSVGSVTSGTAMTVKPAVTTTYTLTVSGTGTPATAKVTVTVTAATQPPSISSFTVGTPSITAGNSTTLTAMFSNGTGSVNNGVGTVTSGTPMTIIPSATTTYTLTVSGTGTTATAQATVTVNPSTGTGTLTVAPSSLSFNYQMGGSVPGSKTVSISSTGGSTSFTATETDPWLSISPKSGTGTPMSITASVNPAGLAQGSHGAQINITAANGKTLTVTVSLMVTTASGGDGGGGTSGSLTTQAYVSDTQSGALASAWVDNLGTSPHGGSDPLNRALVLSKGASAPTNGWAGAVIQNVNGMSLTEVGFDLNADIQCSTNTVHFIITTTDGTSHTLGGCTSTFTATQSSAPAGWMRLRFDPSKASPAIGSTEHVQSISIELGNGSTSTGSIAVIDNIYINGAFTGKGSSSSTSRSRDD